MKDRKVVLITGATGTVGRLLTQGFLENGSIVYVTSRSEEKAQAFCNSFDNHGDSLLPIIVDLNDTNSTETIINEIENNKIYPTVLVNNARNKQYLVRESQAPVSQAQWMGELQLGLVTPYHLTLALAQIKHSKLHSVVNIASMYGVVAQNKNLYPDSPQSLVPHYGATKAALIQLTKELAVDLAEKNIRVNSVSYGGIKSSANDEFEKKYARFSPQQRMLSDSELFEPVNFLVSQGASAITGHNLIVDGGWSIW